MWFRMDDAYSREAKFYEDYTWCLNPALPVGDLVCRYCEELDRHPTRTGWQREESKINLYALMQSILKAPDRHALWQILFLLSWWTV